jgi:Family of unknown function (DUF6192)
MAQLNERLVRAKAYLAIAESKDSKREAYKRAAKEIVAYKQESRETWDSIAMELGCSVQLLYKLRKWHEVGFKGETPFLMDGEATTRAAISHTKAVLRDQPIEVVEKIVADLPAKRVGQIAQAAISRPGVAREMAQDAEASSTVTRFSGQVHEHVRDRVKNITRKARDGALGKAVDGLGVLVEVVGNLNSAKLRLRDSYAAARDLDLNDEHREAVIEELEEIEQIIDWYRSYVESGDQSFEDELASLLGGEK